VNLPFKPIHRPATLSQFIMENVERSILERKLVPGQKLPTEQALCEMFSVSRTAVREALRMLSAKGLISIRRRSGSFVNDLSTGDTTSSFRLLLNLAFDREYVDHVLALRVLIEPEVARWAAAQRTEEDLVRLQKNLDAMAKADPADPVFESALDQEFHVALAAASHNPVVPLVLQPVFTLMPRIRALVYRHVPHCETSALAYHRKMFRAIRAGEGDQAAEIMRRHVEIARAQWQQVARTLQPGEAARKRNGAGASPPVKRVRRRP